MILDCCLFNDEYDVLDLRIRNVLPYVDKMLIVEADRTHSGEYRKPALKDGYGNGSYGDKIVIQYSSLEYSSDRWEIENAHRRSIGWALDLWKYDFVMVSDVDEIPDMRTWSGNEGVFTQRHSYFTPYWVDPRPWNGTVCLSGWRFKSPYGSITPQDARNFRDLLKPCGWGWHLGWMGSVEKAQKKIRDFAHSELMGKDQQLLEAYRQHKHPADGTQLFYDNSYLPDGISMEA